MEGDFDYKKVIHLHHTPEWGNFLLLPPFLLTFYWPVLKEPRKLYCTANAAFAITALTNVASSSNKLSENDLCCLCVWKYIKHYLSSSPCRASSVNNFASKLVIFASKSKWFSLLSSIQCCSVTEDEYILLPKICSQEQVRAASAPSWAKAFKFG